MRHVTTLLPGLVAAALCGPVQPAAAQEEATTTPFPAAADATPAIVAAAEAFLLTLPDEQREQVAFAFGPPGTATAEVPGQRITFVGERFGEAAWSNFPVSDVPRPGLRLGEMSEDGRAAALAVLEAILSAEGY